MNRKQLRAQKQCQQDREVTSVNATKDANSSDNIYILCVISNLDTSRREMKVGLQGRRKRGRPKRRWLDKVRDYIKEKGLSADEVYDRAKWKRTSTPQQIGNKPKRKKKILQYQHGCVIGVNVFENVNKLEHM